MKRIMIAGTHSGCGKTTITCAILQALINRKVKVVSFKCGPDYIDPMFHRNITGIASYNLDRKFCDKLTINRLLYEKQADFSLIEGVMGFYDGAEIENSSCGISLDTQTPVVIVIDCKGISQSVGAIMQGYLNFRRNNIKGFIFNRLSDSLIEQTKKLCFELKTEYLGRLPKCPDAVIKSRHLGLVTVGEISDIKQKTEHLARLAEKNILLDRIITIAENTPEIYIEKTPLKTLESFPIKIAVARDRAFCFYYEENFDLLKKFGCKITEFSPLTDKKLPSDIDGLWIGGGYPELYASELSLNKSIMKSIKSAVSGGLPTIAECGGFMYLCNSITDKNNNSHKMVGVFGGNCFPTEKLQRFGYADLISRSENMLCDVGGKLTAHEFHYWDCTDNGNSYCAVRSRGRKDFCVHSSETLYAGFPHIYLNGCPDAAEKFIKKCMEYHKNEQNKSD